jgi:hypothetical protein
LLALQSSAMHREPVRAILHAIFVIDYQSFNHQPSLLTLHHPSNKSGEVG